MFALWLREIFASNHLRFFWEFSIAGLIDPINNFKNDWYFRYFGKIPRENSAGFLDIIMNIPQTFKQFPKMCKQSKFESQDSNFLIVAWNLFWNNLYKDQPQATHKKAIRHRSVWHHLPLPLNSWAPFQSSSAHNGCAYIWQEKQNKRLQSRTHVYCQIFTGIHNHVLPQPASSTEWAREKRRNIQTDR